MRYPSSPRTIAVALCSMLLTLPVSLQAQSLTEFHNMTPDEKRAYMDSLLAHPNFVGAHWFQYIDSPISGRAFDGENYNVGFVSVTDIPYPEMVAAIRDHMSTVYPERYESDD